MASQHEAQCDKKVFTGDNIVFDYTGLMLGKVPTKPRVIVSDKKIKERKMYAVHRSWLDLEKEGMVNVPVPTTTNEPLIRTIVNYLLEIECAVGTNSVLVPTLNKSYTISWNPLPIRSIYAQFELCEKDAADKFIDKYGEDDSRKSTRSQHDDLTVGRIKKRPLKSDVSPVKRKVAKGKIPPAKINIEAKSAKLPKAHQSTESGKKRDMQTVASTSTPDFSLHSRTKTQHNRPPQISKSPESSKAQTSPQVSMSTTSSRPQTSQEELFTNNLLSESFLCHENIRSSALEREIRDKLTKLEGKLEAYIEEDRAWKKNISEYLLSLQPSAFDWRYEAGENNLAPKKTPDLASRGDLQKKYNFPLSTIDDFINLNDILGVEGSVAEKEVKQYIMSFQTSDFAAVLEKIFNPALTVEFEKNDFLKSPIFALCKQYFMTWKTIKKYKTPEKYQKKNISWRDMPKEEKVEHSAYKWYRNRREQELNKAAGKKKLQRKKRSNDKPDITTPPRQSHSHSPLPSNELNSTPPQSPFHSSLPSNKSNSRTPSPQSHPHSSHPSPIFGLSEDEYDSVPMKGWNAAEAWHEDLARKLPNVDESTNELESNRSTPSPSGRIRIIVDNDKTYANL